MRARWLGIYISLLVVIGLAKQRVAERVATGGHNIPTSVIERRYIAGIRNLFDRIMKEVDIWILYDNSHNKGERIAFGGRKVVTKVNNQEKFNKIKNYE